MVKFIFLILIGVSLFLSCTNKYESSPLKPKVVELDTDQELLKLSDSTFYNGFEEFINADEKLYLADKSPRIFKLNTNLDPVTIIQNNGRGPGEFTYVTDMSLSRDSLYVFSRPQAKIVVFDNKDQYTREIHIEELTGARHIEVAQNGFLYISTPFSNKPITVFNSNGEKINSFGEQTADPDHFNVYRNERMLVLHGDKLIAASPSDPLVWIYNLEGKLLYRLNINHPKLKDRIAEVEESYAKPSPQGGGID